LKEDNGDHWDMNAKAFADEVVVEAFKAEEGGRIVKENSFFLTLLQLGAWMSE
jgi:hypothetical protein